MGSMGRIEWFITAIFIVGLCNACDNSSPINLPITPPLSLYHFIDDDCIAPYWRGIVPGTTDQATAAHAVNQVGHKRTIVKGSSTLLIKNKNVPYETTFYQLTRGDNLSLASRDNIVARIRLYLGVDNRPTLSDITEVFGEPDEICPFDKTIPDTSPEYETNIVYIKRGIWVSSDSKPRITPDGSEVFPEMKVNQITFFKPNEELEFVIVELAYPSRVLHNLIDCLREWEGFGVYKYWYGW